MRKEDAAKILGITGEMTAELIKKAYRSACMKYHPDRNAGGEEMMKAVNLAYETLQDFEGTLDAGAEGYDQAMMDILNKLKELHGLNIEVCGAWIWVTGETKPHKETLGKNGLGLFWANQKKAWYFRPEDWKSTSRGNWSLDEIRTHHGSQVVKSTEKGALVYN